ncbi:hypothetical protein [Halioxenophilus sp. WMMB6]|uniref:hypothetical protein n=1 Tax=Halioxenophilus sp. WMMB6 TaxID=3073815 RepID=UPI00295E4490|nr:hypothetical protein [Halioxenophilus sp. WMMB6]
MPTAKITRRLLISAGVAAGVAALIPLSGLLVSLPEEDLAPIAGDKNAPANQPYRAEQTGSLDGSAVSQLQDFCRWAIAAWALPGLDDYAAQLPALLELKTQQAPSYLAEYQSAAALLMAARAREKSDDQAYTYALFAGRDLKNSNATRLGRAERWVFNELVRHMIKTGGFRRFGSQNYDGFINVAFTEAGAFRRS